MMNHTDALNDNVTLLEQGVAILEKMTDTQYTHSYKIAFNAAVGSHFRHCYDFYCCIISGIQHGRVDYNLRQRNEQFIQDRCFAANQLRVTIQKLESLHHVDSNACLLVREDTESWSQSTFVRELQFLLSHTVHHYALIAVMLHLNGVETPPEFGVAPSTLRYWATQ